MGDIMKKIVNLANLELGMELAQDILDRNGRLLVKKSTKLSLEMIKKIKSFTSYDELYIVSSEKKISIVVKEDNGESVVVDSDHVKVETNQNRIELKKKLGEMQKTLEDTFQKLNVNITDSKAKDELDRTVDDIKSNLNVNINLLEEIVEIKDVDRYLYVHSLNVAMVANLIGRWMKLHQDDLEILIRGGLLHDIGKLRVDQKVLNKPGKLTPEEFKEIKKHSVYSHNMIIEAGYNDKKLLKAVTFHHEKQDGSGYPLGIKEENIPIHARILAVADIFDAMTSKRVYKNRVSPFKVLEMFQNQTFGKLDPAITTVFVRKFAEYYLGSHVKLNNGLHGTIVSLNHYEVTKPLIRTKDGNFIDISRDRSVEILDFQN